MMSASLPPEANTGRPASLEAISIAFGLLQLVADPKAAQAELKRVVDARDAAKLAFNEREKLLAQREGAAAVALGKSEGRAVVLANEEQKLAARSDELAKAADHLAIERAALAVALKQAADDKERFLADRNAWQAARGTAAADLDKQMKAALALQAENEALAKQLENERAKMTRDREELDARQNRLAAAFHG